MNRYPIPNESRATLCTPRRGVGCGGLVFWIQDERGERVAVNSDGLPHCSTCSNSNEFKERARLEARLSEVRKEAGR